MLAELDEPNNFQDESTTVTEMFVQSNNVQESDEMFDGNTFLLELQIVDAVNYELPIIEQTSSVADLNDSSSADMHKDHLHYANPEERTIKKRGRPTIKDDERSELLGDCTPEERKRRLNNLVKN